MTIGAEYVIVYWVLGERETFLGAAAVTVIGFAVWNLGAFEDALSMAIENCTLLATENCTLSGRTFGR